MKTEENKRKVKLTAKERKKRQTKIVGAGVLALALVGVITVISLLIGLIASFFDDSDRKAKFEKFIAPVVMVDPVAFSDVGSADEHVMLMSSMWNLLQNVGETTSYPEDEYGMMLIPASDLDVSASNLFGSSAVLAHQTFGNTNINFEYNQETSSYTVPPMGYTVQYQPRVDKIKRKGKLYTLTVSYISSATNLTDDEEIVADKQMLYVLEKTGKDKYIIKSVLDIEGEAVSSSQSEVSSKPIENTSSKISKTETSSDISKTETSSKGSSSSDGSGTKNSSKNSSKK